MFTYNSYSNNNILQEKRPFYPLQTKKNMHQKRPYLGQQKVSSSLSVPNVGFT
jgi:hypothetical protein